MRHHTGVRAVVLVMAWTVVGRAAESEGKVVRMSLESAVARAEEVSPMVRLAHAERRVVESARLGAAMAMPSNPVIAASAGTRFDRSQTVPPAQGFEWGVRLEQSFEVGGQRNARLTEVRRHIDVADARERLARIEARARVRGAYVAALLGETRVGAARHREELGEQVLTSARSRAAAGAASDVEIRLAEVERGQAVHDRVEAELGSARAASELTWLLGFEPGTRLELSTDVARPPMTTEPVERLIEAARRQREDVKILDATHAALDATFVRLGREAIPNPGVFVDALGQPPGQTYLGGGVAMAVPVFRRNQGERAIVAAEREQTDEETNLLERRIAFDVEALYREVAARREEARLWSDEIVPAAENGLELVTDGWRAGKFDLFRVVQVAREAGEARRKQLEVVGAAWQTAIELDRATGAPR